jgi:5-amino-6-(5-phosphoribosylamino)uracil reductase
MSADGKIADAERSPARFGSQFDKSHLETQIAEADAVLFGAGTLRAYGTTLRLYNPLLLKKRQQQGRQSQPIHIVCSGSADLDPQLFFFQQPIPRWLLTTPQGASRWQHRTEFEQIITFSPQANSFWTETWQQFSQMGIKRLVVTGGGELVATLLAEDLIDEFWLTVCPLLLGGANTPTPVMGAGFLERSAPRLELLSAEVIEQEVFLHYRRNRADPLK